MNRIRLLFSVLTLLLVRPSFAQTPIEPARLPCDCGATLGELAQSDCELSVSLLRAQLFLPYETGVTFDLFEKGQLPLRMRVQLNERGPELRGRVVRIDPRDMPAILKVAAPGRVSVEIQDVAFSGFELSRLSKPELSFAKLTLSQINPALDFLQINCR